MLKTISELQNLILNDETYGGCAIDLPNGWIIGTTSGGFQPVLYRFPENDRSDRLSWKDALELYNKIVG